MTQVFDVYRPIGQIIDDTGRNECRRCDAKISLTRYAYCVPNAGKYGETLRTAPFCKACIDALLRGEPMVAPLMNK